MKPMDMFGKNKRTLTGLNYICKECHNSQVKETQRKRTLRTDLQLKADLARLRPTGMKKCRACHIIIPVSSFGRSVYCADGLNDNCKDCNRKRVNKGNVDYRKRSSKQIADRRRLKYPEGMKCCPECMKDKPFDLFYDEPQRPYGISRMCKECHLGTARGRYVNRREAVVFTLTERYGYVCLYPDCPSTEDLQIDHVIPVVQGGDSSIDNYQLLCSYHNSSKGGNYADYRFDKGKSLMV